MIRNWDSNKNYKQNRRWKMWILTGIGMIMLVCGGCQNRTVIQKEQTVQMQDTSSEVVEKVIEGLKAELGAIRLNPDDTENIKITIEGDTDAVYQLQYESSDVNVCSVEQDGTVKAIRAGKATITIEDVISGKKVRVLILVTNTADVGQQETEQQTESDASEEDTSAENSASERAENSTATTEASTQATTTETEAVAEVTTESVTAGSYMDAYAEQVLAIVNEERSAAGLSSLTMNYTLVSAAKVRAAETVQSFSHTRPNGTSCFTAFDEAGVSYYGAGENIAAGQSTPTTVMQAWMDSEGHKANILNESFTEIGIACYYDPNSTYGYYWVQCFIY